jgi:hypothetical protein
LLFDIFLKKKHTHRNRCPSGYGGALYVSLLQAPVEIRNCQFYSNGAAISGGAIEVRASSGVCFFFLCCFVVSVVCALVVVLLIVITCFFRSPLMTVCSTEIKPTMAERWHYRQPLVKIQFTGLNTFDWFLAFTECFFFPAVKITGSTFSQNGADNGLTSCLLFWFIDCNTFSFIDSWRSCCCERRVDCKRPQFNI